MRPEIDELDRAIVDLLREDARMASAEIARRLGYASRKTVTKRIRRLVQKGIIRLRVIPDPAALGYPITADISVETESGKVREVARMIAELDRVSYVAIITGDRDLMAQVHATDMRDLQALITDELQAIPGVIRTRTVMLTEIVKDIDRWGIPRGAARETDTELRM